MLSRRDDAGIVAGFRSRKRVVVCLYYCILCHNVSDFLLVLHDYCLGQTAQVVMDDAGGDGNTQCMRYTFRIHKNKKKT
jgi:hypothetical protein